MNVCTDKGDTLLYSILLIQIDFHHYRHYYSTVKRSTSPYFLVFAGLSHVVRVDYANARYAPGMENAPVTGSCDGELTRDALDAHYQPLYQHLTSIAELVRQVAVPDQ